MEKIGQNRHTICKTIIVLETADEIEKDGVGNAYYAFRCFTVYCVFAGNRLSPMRGEKSRYICGRLIIAPTAGMVDFAVVLSFFGGIGECRPTVGSGKTAVYPRAIP